MLTGGRCAVVASTVGQGFFVNIKIWTASVKQRLLISPCRLCFRRTYSEVACTPCQALWWLSEYNRTFNKPVCVLAFRKSEDQEEEEGSWNNKKGESHLEVKAYGFKTIYYVVGCFPACNSVKNTKNTKNSLFSMSVMFCCSVCLVLF